MRHLVKKLRNVNEATLLRAKSLAKDQMTSTEAALRLLPEKCVKTADLENYFTKTDNERALKNIFEIAEPLIQRGQTWAAVIKEHRYLQLKTAKKTTWKQSQKTVGIRSNMEKYFHFPRDVVFTRERPDGWLYHYAPLAEVMQWMRKDILHSYVKVASTTYRQIEGTPMGSPLGNCLAKGSIYPELKELPQRDGVLATHDWVDDMLEIREILYDDSKTRPIENKFGRSNRELTLKDTSDENEYVGMRITTKSDRMIYTEVLERKKNTPLDYKTPRLRRAMEIGRKVRHMRQTIWRQMAT